jgi:hypothetical protein
MFPSINPIRKCINLQTTNAYRFAANFTPHNIKHQKYFEFVIIFFSLVFIS